MAIIKKKCWPEFFELLKSGRKCFDVRAADFKIEEGDTLILEEYDPEKKKYTGRTIKKKVGYTLHFPLNKFSQKKLIEKRGFYIIQLED